MAGRRRKIKFQPDSVVEMPSDHQIELFFSHLETEFEPSLTDAARYASISKKAFDLASAKHPEFGSRLREWESQRLLQIEEQAYAIARKGDPGMVRFLLQSKMPQVYGTKGKLDLNVNVTSPADLSALTDEQLADLKTNLIGGAS